MNQARLLLLSVSLVSVSTLPVWLLGSSFFEIGPEFGLNAFHFGLLTGLFFLTASISSLLVGHRIPLIGWQRAIRVNLAITIAALVGFATVVHSTGTLVALLVPAAAAYGISNPASNLALAFHTTPHRVGAVFGIKHAGIPSPTLLAGLAVPALVVEHGWRAAFWMAAVLGLGVWLLIPRHVSPHSPPPWLTPSLVDVGGFTAVWRVTGLALVVSSVLVFWLGRRVGARR